jgi:hypothetical protein
MIRLLKTVCRPVWRATAPVRRPILARLDAQRRQSVAAVVTPSQDDLRAVCARIEESLLHARARAEQQAGETNLLLDSLVREIARLQQRVDDLHEPLARPETDASLRLLERAPAAEDRLAS